MKRKTLAFILLAAFLFSPACGKWNPATVQDMRDTFEHKKEKAGDRYRFVAPDGKTLHVTGKNLNLDGDDLLVRKDRMQYRIPLDQTQKIEKFKLNAGATIGAIFGGIAGLVAVGLIPGLANIDDDS
ncbi:MAG: hypothetical protein F9K48_01170 [Candidatus Brocadia sp.]|nr:MAG: hypothetical protein F9K48_01170 [Candidatus Brocadia sp.]